MRDSNRRLSALKVVKLARPGLYGDGGGLYLQIAVGGTKSWVLRFMRSGRARKMGLGPVDIVSLADARERGRAARRQLLDGIDPIEARHEQRAQQRLEEARGVTFKQCAERYIAAHEAGWRNPKHRTQWRSTLATYAYPVCGDLSVAAIDTALVLKAVEPIWTEKPETAGRVRGRIESVLDWAKARGYRSGDNPARWRGHLDHLLPKRSKVQRVEHYPAMAYADIPHFMADLRKRESTSARALEFLVLNAARTGAVIGATWDEIDTKEKVWTVPASRIGTKINGDKPRKVPLSIRSLEILASLPHEEGNPHVFIGGKPGQGLSNMAMAELLKGMAYPSTTPGELATVHGMRSAFKDWATERTNYPNEVSEAALWHVVADKTEAAYRRGELLEKRRRLMADWAKFCSAPRSQLAAKVLALHGKRSAR
jgi:integrase